MICGNIEGCFEEGEERCSSRLRGTQAKQLIEDLRGRSSGCEPFFTRG